MAFQTDHGINFDATHILRRSKNVLESRHGVIRYTYVYVISNFPLLPDMFHGTGYYKTCGYVQKLFPLTRDF